MNERSLFIEFYKENLEFPISGGDTMSATYEPTIRRILTVLKPLIGKRTNVQICERAKEKIFIKNLISFCKLEGIDYNQLLELDVRWERDRFKIIVNYGSNSDVQTLTI